LIETLKTDRDSYMERYNAARKSMILLVSFDPDSTDSAYPPLTPKDLVCKNSEARRPLNDSHRPDGKVFALLPLRSRNISFTNGLLTANLPPVVTGPHEQQQEDVGQTDSDEWEDEPFADVPYGEECAGTHMPSHRARNIGRRSGKVVGEKKRASVDSGESEGWIFATRKTKHMGPEASRAGKRKVRRELASYMLY
jgi:hypothetical protein